MDVAVKRKLGAIRQRLKNDMGLFGRTCFPTAYKKDTPPFHGDIYKSIKDRNEKRVLIAAPRGTAKSTIISLIFPMYLIAFKERKHDEFIVIISESRQQSVNFLSRIKSHLDDNGPFRLLFGDFSEDTAKRWREDDIILRNGVRIVAIGTGSKIRGYIEKDTRPTVLIMDDIESEKNAFTPEARAKNRAWVTEAVLPSLADEGRAVMIGTVISEDCYLYRARDTGTWKVLWFSILKDDGKSIWPEKYPLERITAIKTEMASMGRINGFFQEYMNQAQSPDEAPFQSSYIKIHHYTLEYDSAGMPYLQGETENREDDEIERIPIDIYQGVDPASSLSAKADFFVIATIGVDYKGNRYILDLYRNRLRTALQPAKIIELYLKFKPIRVKIETVAYQEALRDGTRAQCDDRGIYIPGLEAGVKPRNSKSERLLSLVPTFAKGKFFFRPGDIEAQKEFMSYPRGKNDDIMDAIWTALQKTYPCRRQEPVLGKSNKKKEVEEQLDWMVL